MARLWRSCQLNVEVRIARLARTGRHSTRHARRTELWVGERWSWRHRSSSPPRRLRAISTPTSSRPCGAATTAPSSSSTPATSAASPPTCSGWSRTTAAPRTSRRRSSSPRCAACATTDRAIAFKPWIYEIAKNACIDQFRRSRRTEEVSFDAGEGLGGADQGRLVAAEPTPDAAVDAKQQLEQLCGAFGGLSDSHHEILVLREFEGLSYREIGDRMGLSRPGVESTLFRARKRLTEEYDELVSGQRCVRIQSIIAAAASSRAGRARHAPPRPPHRPLPAVPPPGRRLRDRRRRSWRASRSAQRIAAKVAGLLPLPAFLRARLWHGSEQIVPVSEPMAAAWSKAVAVAATVIVVGVGAGVAPQTRRRDAGPACARRPKPAAVAKRLRRHRRPARARPLAGAATPREPARKRAPRSAPAAAAGRPSRERRARARSRATTPRLRRRRRVGRPARERRPSPARRRRPSARRVQTPSGGRPGADAVATGRSTTPSARSRHGQRGRQRRRRGRDRTGRRSVARPARSAARSVRRNPVGGAVTGAARQAVRTGTTARRSARRWRGRRQAVPWRRNGAQRRVDGVTGGLPGLGG